MKFTAAGLRCRQNLKYENFTSSFGRLRQKIAPKSVPLVRTIFFFIQPIKSLVCGVVVVVVVARAARLCFLIRPIKSLICSVVVAVAVVVSIQTRNN